MTITITGDIDLGGIKSIISEHLDEIHRGLELYISYDSFHRIMEHDEVKRSLVYMNPADLIGGRITLYGASIKTYFPEIISEEEN